MNAVLHEKPDPRDLRRPSGADPAFSQSVAGRWLAVLILSLLASGAGAQTSAEAPRTVRVVLDNNYAPYSFQAGDGKLQGILVDQWQAWEKQTGLKVRIDAMNWAEALRRMRAGEYDVIDTIVETEERRGYLEFTPDYATVEVPIFFRHEISGITDLGSLKEFPVGVKEGDQHIDKLRASGVTTLISFQDFSAMIEAAKQRKINVFLADAPSALYLLNKAGLEVEFRSSTPIFRDGLKRAVRKGDTVLLHQVMQGFAAIDPGELKQIDEKWFGRALNWYGRYLAYAGYAAAGAILLIAGLTGWNRLLRRRVLQRTAALVESEERFRQIAENIHEVFWLTTADLSKMLYVSPAYEAIWGRSCESLYQVPRSFIAAIHPEDRRHALEALDQNRDRGFAVEYRVVRPDGSIRWIWDRGFPIKDEATRAYRTAGIAEDITERKLAAETMRQVEDRIRLVIDTIPAMAWSIRPDGATDFVNQRWLDYTGLSLEEELENPTNVIHPEDLSRVVEKWLVDMSAGKPSEDEMRLRRADGEYRWFLVRTAPLRDERGTIVKWYGSSFDIEDRKRAEMQSRVLVDAIPDQIWSGPPEGKLDYCNERWRSYTGLKLEELQGDGWQAILHPDDRDRVIRAWDEAVANGTPYEQEERHRGADGAYRWFLSRGGPLRDADGHIVRWYGTNTDIEDRKVAEGGLQRSERELREREELYRVLAENANDFIRMHDPETRSIYASPSVERLYGRAPTHLFEFAHPEDLKGCRQWLTRVLAGSGEHFVWRVRNGTGDWRWLESRASLIQHHGRPHVMTVCRDVTERKEAEEALRGSEVQLHALVGRLNTVREDEAKRIARELHDVLGQKLTALNMELADLERKLVEATPGQRAQIDGMHATVDQTIEAVQELSSELRLGQLDILGLTAAIDWQIKEFSRRSRIPCLVTRLDEIENLSDAQRTAVFRILQEALTNIVRHAGATQVEISLRAGPDRLALKVHDNGRGITAAELNDQKAIGLLGMRERAQLVDGEVTVTGGTGAGTTVLVTIPLQRPPIPL